MKGCQTHSEVLNSLTPVPPERHFVSFCVHLSFALLSFSCQQSVAVILNLMLTRVDDS